MSAITSSSTFFLVPGLTLIRWLLHADADWHDGWDALQTAAALLPDPPPEPAGAQNRTSWQWDGQNGNNGVWFGNTKAGVRLELKGDDPLWWAGAPYDNGASPKPPDSWHNEGAGGIDAYHNGSAVFYSGLRPMRAGESVPYAFSLVVTPVRPFDMIERFRDHWAQGGLANYTELHSKGVTVMNIHQVSIAVQLPVPRWHCLRLPHMPPARPVHHTDERWLTCEHPSGQSNQSLDQLPLPDEYRQQVGCRAMPFARHEVFGLQYDERAFEPLP